MTVNAITDTKKGRTGIAPTYLHTTQILCCWFFNTSIPPLFCGSNHKRLELASVPCGGTVNRSHLSRRNCPGWRLPHTHRKAPSPFTWYSTRRTVNYFSESESEPAPDGIRQVEAVLEEPTNQPKRALLKVKTSPLSLTWDTCSFTGAMRTLAFYP